MAKIRQLTNTYQPNQQSVSVPTLRVDALAPGLAEGASSYLASQQMKMQYQAQKSQAQGERASWEMEDWLNRFKMNMNSPQKLKEAFKSTPYESLAVGINADVDIYDSSVAQHLYRQAIEVTGKGIDDEATRNSWMTSKMREWEAIEPGFQMEADKWIQTEARNTELQNLNSMWKAGIGTTNPAFSAKLDDMVDKGFFGSEATTAIQTRNDLLLNYQKSEQTALMDKILNDTLMPYAVTGATEEALNVVLAGIDLSMNGQNYLTQDERDTIVERHMNHAKNYSALYNQKVEEGHKVWEDDNWQEIMGIVNSKEITPGQKIAMAQSKVNNLIGSYNKNIAPYDTGIADMPAVELGSPDGDSLKKMIDYLNKYVSQNGSDAVDPQMEAEAAIIMNQTLIDEGLTPSAKKMIGDQLLRDGLTTVTRYKVANAMEWDKQTTSDLIDQLNNFYEGAGGLNQGELEVGINSVINGFADDNVETMKLVDTWQNEAVNFWAGWVSSKRNPKVEVRDNLKNFQKQIEAGNMAGMVQQAPEMFSEYATYVGEYMQEGFMNGALKHINIDNVVKNEAGEPEIVARLVDPYGQALIAVRTLPDPEDGRAAPPGFENDVIKVRIFSPTTGRTRSAPFGGSSTELEFTELTDDSAYYLSLNDINGNQMSATPSDGSLPIANRTLMAFTGRYTAYGQPIMEEISIDPDFILEVQRGSKPF